MTTTITVNDVTIFTDQETVTDENTYTEDHSTSDDLTSIAGLFSTHKLLTSRLTANYVTVTPSHMATNSFTPETDLQTSRDTAITSSQLTTDAGTSLTPTVVAPVVPIPADMFQLPGISKLLICFNT